MYRFIFGMDAYTFFDYVAIFTTLIVSIFFHPSKRETLGLHSKRMVSFVSRKNSKLGNILIHVFVSLESYIMALLIVYCAVSYNMAFGKLVGTGANYFATLFLISPIWFIASAMLMINPLKQIDISTLIAPVYLALVKLGCFTNGCCWGIPWKYGLYNYHYHHPGRQVPVQLIEMFFALAIFVFLMFYRKKAKTGTIFPMYMILYGGTRFFSEFLTAAYPDVIGPFNVYQILCMSAVVIGIILFILASKFGERISDFFDRQCEKLDAKQVQKEDKKLEAIAEYEAQEIERKEKVKLAREKAKARRRK